ncbi:hypothetical protein K1719_015679 [Acacia pycnantha]|nr:hypothetical protein K1719_015679 [Acacia pycnantha]
MVQMVYYLLNWTGQVVSLAPKPRSSISCATCWKLLSKSAIQMLLCGGTNSINIGLAKKQITDPGHFKLHLKSKI